MKVFVSISFWCVSMLIHSQIPIDSIIRKLENIQSCKATALYSVTQPLTDDVVDYTLDMTYQKTPSDSLGGTAYYIEITDGHPAVKGNFYCYSSGDYFNFANQRLREYHASENAEPFRTRQSDDYTIPGVHLSGLFVSELPSEIVKELRRFKDNPDTKISITTDSAYGEPSNIIISVIEQKKDIPLREITYKFDANTFLPKFKEIVNSPGHIASQTLTTHYEDVKINPILPDDYFTEKQLLREKPEIMASFRKGNFRAEQLKGHPAPEFSLPALSENNSRYTLTSGKNMKILLFADTKASFCPPAIEQLDSLCQEEKTEFKILFKEAARSDIEKYREENDLTNNPPLYNASNVAAQYGVTGFPTVFLLTPDNKIADIYVGYSPDLSQKVAEGISSYQESCKTNY